MLNPLFLKNLSFCRLFNSCHAAPYRFGKPKGSGIVHICFWKKICFWKNALYIPKLPVFQSSEKKIHLFVGILRFRSLFQVFILVKLEKRKMLSFFHRTAMFVNH
jgi:hypothetical protein